MFLGEDRFYFGLEFGGLESIFYFNLLLAATVTAGLVPVWEPGARNVFQVFDPGTWFQALRPFSTDFPGT